MPSSDPDLDWTPVRFRRCVHCHAPTLPPLDAVVSLCGTCDVAVAALATVADGVVFVEPSPHPHPFTVQIQAVIRAWLADARESHGLAIPLAPGLAHPWGEKIPGSDFGQIRIRRSPTGALAAIFGQGADQVERVIGQCPAG